MIKTLLACVVLCASATAFAQPHGAVADWAAKPARAWSAPAHMMLLGAARAGSRIVAVGEHEVENGLLGVGLDGLLLKQDAGAKWFEVAQRPDRATLTAVVIAGDGKPVWLSQDGVLAAR